MEWKVDNEWIKFQSGIDTLRIDTDQIMYPCERK